MVENPNLMAELDIIRAALFAIGFTTPDQGIGWKDYYVIHTHHMDKFIQLRLKPMMLRKGGAPHMKKTLAIQEFIVRGFIHEDEFNIYPEHIVIKATIAPLVWPELFEHHQDALAKANKVGIPGYTKTILPQYKKTL